MNNIVFLEFYSKQSFPQGPWLSEPDYCQWEKFGLKCLAIRDMSLGVWKGFVGVDLTHPLFAKSVENILHNYPQAMNIFLEVYGGLCSANTLPAMYKEAAGRWWLGIETSHGGDLMPLVKIDEARSSLLGGQTYKDFNFIRRETNKLAKHVSKVK